MNLHQIKTFHLVVTAGSYTKAAKLRDVLTKSTQLSISNLQKSLGYRIFLPYTFKAEMTPKGKWLLPRATVIVDVLKEIESMFPKATRMHKITVHQLRTFQILAIAGSYKEAAKRTNLHTSSIQKNIQTLSHSLTCNLFVSSKGRVELTPEGEKLLPIAKTLTDQYAEIEEYFKTSPEKAEQLSAA